jgi:phenylacetic acid degradation operon negative regulatory protein
LVCPTPALTLSLGLLHARTEELLYFLLWSAEGLVRPTFRNLDDSFESWAYRNGFLRRIAELEREKFLERKSRRLDHRIYRLTAEGRLHALGGRDPQVQWARFWDGRWRLVLFDVPATENARRDRLRRTLQEQGFGYLQNSVWITPDALPQQLKRLRGEKADVQSLLVLDARPCAGETDAQIVAGAWDFDRINRLYRQHLKILNQKPVAKLNNENRRHALRQWAEDERMAWNKAILADPLLPTRLLPPGYLGQRAWQRRVEVLGKAKRDLLTF